MSRCVMIFADEIAALLPDRRIARIRDEEDARDLAVLLAHAFGVSGLVPAITEALLQRRKETGEPL